MALEAGRGTTLDKRRLHLQQSTFATTPHTCTLHNRFTREHLCRPTKERLTATERGGGETEPRPTGAATKRANSSMRGAVGTSSMRGAVEMGTFLPREGAVSILFGRMALPSGLLGNYKS